MPLLLLPLIAFALGAGISLTCPTPLSVEAHRELRRAAAWFIALALAPMALHCTLAQPAWALLYLFDPRSWPAAALGGLALGASAFGLLGLDAAERVSRAQPLQRLLVAGVPALVGLSALSASSRAISLLGSQPAYLAGSERSLTPILDSNFGASLLLLDTALVVAYLLTLRRAHLLGRASATTRIPP